MENNTHIATHFFSIDAVQSSINVYLELTIEMIVWLKAE